MLNLKPVILEYGDYICRRCLDRRYAVHLAHRDVVEAEGTCPCCKQAAKLVTDLKLGGRLKMLRK